MSTLRTPLGTPAIHDARVRGTTVTLDDVAVRKAADYPEVSAGSILRCVFRAAHGLRMAGVTHARVPSEAERVTRALLDRRTGLDRRHGLR